MKSPITQTLALALALALPAFAFAQFTHDLPGPICIGDDGHPECDPAEPIGLELVLTVGLYEEGASVPFSFDYAQVAPASRYTNSVYVNDVWIGDLNPSADESDCVTSQTFSMDIGPLLEPWENTVRIVSGHNASEDNYDDVWIRNINVGWPAVSDEGTTWGAVKSSYR